MINSLLLTKKAKSMQENAMSNYSKIENVIKSELKTHGHECGTRQVKTATKLCDLLGERRIISAYDFRKYLDLQKVDKYLPVDYRAYLWIAGSLNYKNFRAIPSGSEEISSKDTHLISSTRELMRELIRERDAREFRVFIPEHRLEELRVEHRKRCDHNLYEYPFQFYLGAKLLML